MVRWRIDHIHQGLKLRRAGLSYRDIVVVFAEYHGIHTTESAVRHQLRAHGAAPHPRGCTTNILQGSTRCDQERAA